MAVNRTHMKLIAAPVSPYSRKVRIVLAEKGVEVRHVPLRDIPEFIRTGKIKHGIVIGGFYWLSLRRRE